MRPVTLQRIHSAALIVATVLLGISWSFALVHVQTHAYPLLWAAAMPALALYYATGGPRTGLARHVPAGAVTVYALILWQVSGSAGSAGRLATILAVLASMATLAFGTRLATAARARAVASARRTSRGRKRRQRLSVER
jgi:hypothetical protein